MERAFITLTRPLFQATTTTQKEGKTHFASSTLFSLFGVVFVVISKASKTFHIMMNERDMQACCELSARRGKGRCVVRAARRGTDEISLSRVTEYGLKIRKNVPPAGESQQYSVTRLGGILFRLCSAERCNVPFLSTSPASIENKRSY